MVSQEARDIDKLYKGIADSLAANPQMGLDEMRRMFSHAGDIAGEPGGVDYIEVDAGGVRAMWAKPKGCAQDRVLICTHGGGYVVCSMFTHRKMYAHFAKEIGCAALIVDYRLAPEHIHPAPVDDVVRAYQWVLDQGIKSNHVAFTGDSAGGALAVTTLLRAREKGLPMPAATMPLSPWLDMDATSPSFESNRDRDLLVSRDIIQAMSGYVSGREREPQGSARQSAVRRVEGPAADVHPSRLIRDAAR